MWHNSNVTKYKSYKMLMWQNAIATKCNCDKTKYEMQQPIRISRDSQKPITRVIFCCILSYLNFLAFTFWLFSIILISILSNLHFITFTFCPIFNLAHLHFATIAFCQYCILSHLHFVTIEFCILCQLYSVLFAFCRTCILALHFV